MNRNDWVLKLEFVVAFVKNNLKVLKYSFQFFFQKICSNDNVIENGCPILFVFYCNDWVDLKIEF